MKKWLLLYLFLVSPHISAQLGFCEGSKGDYIFHEDFGQGTVGMALPAGVTSYNFVTGMDPEDGFYTVANSIGANITSWHSNLPSTTISNGLALIVNADDVNAGRFYQIAIPDLCENTSYEFSAFLMNVYDKSSGVCNFQDIPINVRFEIWDETNSRILKEGVTGDIASSATAKWEQYALTFQTEPGQDSVILKMFNEGVGGCGNDLAIDDIVFRSCGDLTEISSDSNAESPFYICESETPSTLTLTATPDFSVYDQHSYQWQVSDNNQNWQDIRGETNESYTTPEISGSNFYRVKVAEDAVNLSNNLCSTASESFQINFNKVPLAPISNGDITICSNEDIPPLSVSVENGETSNWYDAMENGNLIAEGSTSLFPEDEGTYYAEAVNITSGCGGGARTEVTLTIFESIIVEDAVLQLCRDSQLELDAGIGNMQYLWSTGEISEKILIAEAGNYYVSITTEEGCSTVRNFDIQPVDIAGINEVLSEENRVIINPVHSGNFEYSLDGINYQLSNIFEPVSGGVYTAYMRDLQECSTVLLEFPHIVIQKYLTPNGDGYNDVFILNGVEYFSSSYISLFDRYGKLIKAGNGEDFTWNGTFNGKELPAADFWYEIYIEGFKTIKGNISLVR